MHPGKVFCDFFEVNLRASLVRKGSAKKHLGQGIQRGFFFITFSLRSRSQSFELIQIQGHGLHLKL